MENELLFQDINQDQTCVPPPKVESEKTPIRITRISIETVSKRTGVSQEAVLNFCTKAGIEVEGNKSIITPAKSYSAIQIMSTLLFVVAKKEDKLFLGVFAFSIDGDTIVLREMVKHAITAHTVNFALTERFLIGSFLKFVNIQHACIKTCKETKHRMTGVWMGDIDDLSFLL